MRALTSEDAFFLYSETPEQHMHTVGTIILDPTDAPAKFGVKRLLKKMKEDIKVLPDFRQRLVKPLLSSMAPVLVDDPDFNVRNHIRHIALPAPGTLRELATIIADIASTPLDQKKPLWESWYIEGLEGGKIAVVSKNHHCLADGVSGAEFMAEQFDFEPNPPKKKKIKAKEAWKPQNPNLWKVTAEAAKTRRNSQAGISEMFVKTARSLRNRRKLFQEYDRAAELVPAMIPMAPKLKFNGAITANRSAAIGSASVSDLKFIKNTFGVTLNDVVVCACTMALRKHLLASDDMPEEPLLCAVPVSLTLKDKDKKDKKEQAGGNNVGNMMIKLPAQSVDLESCLSAVHESTVEAKRIFDASFENLMQGYISALPANVASMAMQAMFSKRLMQLMPPNANVVISNFPGPPIPLYMEGAKLEATYPMGPITNGAALNITFMSYMDRMDFSIQSCRELLPDVWGLAEDIVRSFDELKSLAEQKAGVKPDSGTTAKTKTKARIKAKTTRKAKAKQKPTKKAKSGTKKETVKSKRKTPVSRKTGRKTATRKAATSKATLRKVGQPKARSKGKTVARKRKA